MKHDAVEKNVGLLMAFTAVLLPVAAVLEVGGPVAFFQALKEAAGDDRHFAAQIYVPLLGHDARIPYPLG